MYKLLAASGTLGAWKGRYCDAEYERCARFEMASAGRPVPINLLPDGQLLKRSRG